MPCKMVAPTIEALAGEYAGKVKIGKVDTDANRDAAVKFGINAIPTIILFKGGEVAHKFVGVTSREQLVEELDKVAG